MNDMKTEIIKKNFFKMWVVILVVLGFIYILSPLFVPIVLGGILAMAFSPYLALLTSKGLRRGYALSLMTIVLFLLCVTPFSILIIKGTRIVSEFLNQQSLTETKTTIEDKIFSIVDHFSKANEINPDVLYEKLDQLIGSVGSYVLNLVSSFLGGIPNILMLSFMTILTFYFSLLNEEKIRQWFDRFFYFKNDNGDKFIFLLKSSCKEIFFSNVLTGLIQATIVGGGAFFTKSGDFFVVFIITFFLSFIPIIGAAPTGFVVAIGAFLNHRLGAGIAMASVAAFAGIIDNILRPYLSSRGTMEVPTFINFLAIIGGVITFGIAGLFVGPLIASLLYGAIPIILSEWSAPEDRPCE